MNLLDLEVTKSKYEIVCLNLVILPTAPFYIFSEAETVDVWTKPLIQICDLTLKIDKWYFRMTLMFIVSCRASDWMTVPS